MNGRMTSDAPPEKMLRYRKKSLAKSFDIVPFSFYEDLADEKTCKARERFSLRKKGKRPTVSSLWIWKL